jgi:hypothetical protein
MVGLEAHHVSAVSAHGAYKLSAAGFVGIEGVSDLPFCAFADQASRLTPALKVLLYKMPPIFEHDVFSAPFLSSSAAYVNSILPPRGRWTLAPLSLLLCRSRPV